MIAPESTSKTSTASLHLWGFCCETLQPVPDPVLHPHPVPPLITWRFLDLRNTVESFFDSYPDYDKLISADPLQAYPALYGLTFQKAAFAQLGMHWSRLAHLTPGAICEELNQVRSRVRSFIYPEGCPWDNVRFSRHVRSESVDKTNSVPAKFEPTAATHYIRAPGADTAPPPLEKRCLYKTFFLNVFLKDLKLRVCSLL